MKEKPSLPDQSILDHLRAAYGIDFARLDFLPIGDVSSAKYRVVVDRQDRYFLKLRADSFNEISVTVPHFLHEQGIDQVLSPLPTSAGRLWTELFAYTCILYPFIAGQNGFQSPLSPAQWAALGGALKRVHTASLPADLGSQVPVDTYSSHWRDSLKAYLAQAENDVYTDSVAVKMAACLRQHRDEIRRVADRAEELGQALQSRPPECVLCHADIHAGNLLLEADGALHITDWDDPMLAPKERDLMFIGGGIGGIWNTPGEEDLFYRGYGARDIDLTALAYYRCERIVSDTAEFCQQILSSTAGGADRERSLQKFFAAFLPGQAFEIAFKSNF